MNLKKKETQKKNSAVLTSSTLAEADIGFCRRGGSLKLFKKNRLISVEKIDLLRYHNHYRDPVLTQFSAP